MKLLVLNRLNTLVVPKSKAIYPEHPSDQELIPGALSRLKQYVDNGWIPVMVSNFHRVEDGVVTEDEALAEMMFSMNLTGVDQAMMAPSRETDGIGRAVSITRVRREWTAIKIHNQKARFSTPGSGMLIHIYHRLNDFIGPINRKLYVSDDPAVETTADNACFEFIHTELWLQSICDSYN